MREMGCNKSKNNDGVQLGNKKSSNKDKDKGIISGVQQSNILSNAMKTGVAKEKITKRVRFEEAIPDNEKLIAMNTNTNTNVNKEVAESEDEAYFSAQDDIGLKKEKAPKSKHDHKN